MTINNPNARITIVLEYTRSELEFILGTDILKGDFREVVIEQAEEDIRNYLWSEPLQNWATIEIEGDE